MCGPELEQQVSEALRRTGLPADLDAVLSEDVLARMVVDKKRVGSNLRFLMIRGVGACEPVEIAITEVQRILRRTSAP